MPHCILNIVKVPEGICCSHKHSPLLSSAAFNFSCSRAFFRFSSSFSFSKQAIRVRYSSILRIIYVVFGATIYEKYFAISMIELGDIGIEYAVNNKESLMLLKSSKVNAWKNKEGNRG
ncbi:conserved hypothetical protein [Vibrio diabolicus]|nr:conserved hypothetical protein [Vibrio diabolicus]